MKYLTILLLFFCSCLSSGDNGWYEIVHTIEVMDGDNCKYTTYSGNSFYAKCGIFHFEDRVKFSKE